MCKHYIKHLIILLSFTFMVACSKPSESTEISTSDTDFVADLEPSCEDCPYAPLPPEALEKESAELPLEVTTKSQKNKELSIMEQLVGHPIDPIFDAITYYLVDEPSEIFTSAAVVCVKPCTIPDAKCLCEEDMPAFDYLRPKLHKQPVGDIQKVKDLLQQDSDVNAVDAFGRTPLMLAAMGNSQELINLLLEHGADINTKDASTGKTALQFAKDFKQKQTIKTLQQHGAR